QSSVHEDLAHAEGVPIEVNAGRDGVEAAEDHVRPADEPEAQGEAEVAIYGNGDRIGVDLAGSPAGDDGLVAAHILEPEQDRAGQDRGLDRVLGPDEELSDPEEREVLHALVPEGARASDHDLRPGELLLIPPLDETEPVVAVLDDEIALDRDLLLVLGRGGGG